MYDNNLLDYAHKCACRLRKVRRYDSTVTPNVNWFPAGTLRYQETELVYIFLKSFGGW